MDLTKGSRILGEFPKYHEFSEQLNGRFRAHTAQGPVDLELIEATELDRGHRPNHLPTPISLIFSGPADIILTQDNYTLEHPKLGRRSFFITPVLSGEPVPHYQIILS